MFFTGFAVSEAEQQVSPENSDKKEKKVDLDSFSEEENEKVDELL